MKILFLGTGSAFTLKNYQSNIAIEQNGKWLLLDAGGDVRFSLRDAGLSYKDIDSVYISHLHSDHCSGIEALAFCSYFDPSKDKIKLYGNGELLRRGWEDTWKGGLKSVQGKLMSLEDYFSVKPVRPNKYFTWEGIQFHPVQSVHVVNGYYIVPCYGLMIKIPSSITEGDIKTVYWTSDTQFCPHSIMDFYKQADLIIQDCETSPFKSGVHANFSDLVTLPEDIKKRMMLTHYQDNIMNPDSKVNSTWIETAQKAGFQRFTEKGQELIIK